MTPIHFIDQIYIIPKGLSTYAGAFFAGGFFAFAAAFLTGFLVAVFLGPIVLILIKEVTGGHKQGGNVSLCLF